MKKRLLNTAVCAALLCPAIPAGAQEASSLVWRPYVGVDLQRTVLDYNDNYGIGGGLALDGDAILEDALDGLNIHVGNRFHENFGLELGYFRTREESKSVAAGATVGPGTVATANFSTDVQLQGFTLDALGYLPVSEYVDLIGTAGASWIKGELDINVPGVGDGSADESELGFRAGAGAQVHLSERINARALARYQRADFDNIADKAWTYTLGLNYSF